MNIEIIQDSFRAYSQKSGTKIAPSGISYKDVCQLETELGIHLPDEYKYFVSACAYEEMRMIAFLDNFLFMDDVGVSLLIPAVLSGNEKSCLKEHLENNRQLLDLGFIPIGYFDDQGQFESNGTLCIDTKDNNKLVWLPNEFCLGLTTYEEYSDEKIKIFNTFDEFLKCFFHQVKYEINE